MHLLRSPVRLAQMPRLPVSIPGVPDQLALLGGVVFLAFLVVVMVVLFRRKKKKMDPEGVLVEDLALLPPPPGRQRHYKLLAFNQSVRVRLVVVAPVGKQDLGKVDSALEQVLRGLGEVSFDDRARVRVWPGQLSMNAFAPTFFRVTRRPEPADTPSRWILLAGPARVGGISVLLGLALEGETATRVGSVVMNETKWVEVLRVENA